MQIDGSLALSNEQRLLICCSQYPMPDTDVLNGIPFDRISWEIVLQLAREHDLEGILLHNLGQTCLLERLPVKERADLAHQRQTRLARGLRLQEEISRVSKALVARGTRAVFLKGSALVPLVYGSFAVRQMCDIDVLVAADRADETYQFLMQELEYRCTSSLDRQNVLVAMDWHYAPLVHDGFELELHHRLTLRCCPYCPDVAGVIKDACPAQLGKVDILVPSLEDLLTHLCIHLHHHHAVMDFVYSLRRHADIRNLITNCGKRMDWNKLVAKVRDQGIQLPVAYGIYYTEALYGPLVPREAYAAILPQDFDVEKDAMRWLQMGSDEVIGYWHIPYLWRLFGSRTQTKSILFETAADYVADARVRELAALLGRQQFSDREAQERSLFRVIGGLGRAHWAAGDMHGG
jgi:hypothetical protein